MSTPQSVRRLERLRGATAVAWHEPGFGLTDADRLVVSLSDGTSAFLKAATTVQTARWLRHEHRILDLLHGTGLAPAILGWQDEDDRPLLVTEDLSDAYWPAAGAVDPHGGTSTVWRPGDVDAVLETLDRLRRRPTPDGLPRTSSWPGPQWERVLELADELVALGVVVPGWLPAHAQTLIGVDAEADRLELGAHLVHGDVRSDNLCLIGDVGEPEVRLVDWSDAGAGHERHDLVQLLPTLHLEGGPPPWVVCTGPAPLIARLAGPSLQRACVSDQPDWLRRVFVRLATINLTWLATILELPPPVPDDRRPGSQIR